MARYGRDFTGGRYSNRNDFGRDYDFEFDTGTRAHSSSGRGHGWNDFQGGAEWGGSARSPGLGGVNPGWGTRGQPRGDFDGRNWGGGSPNSRETGRYGHDQGFGYGAGEFGPEGYTGQRFEPSGQRPSGYRNPGFADRFTGGRAYHGHGFGGRDMQGGGARMDQEYDRDFADRLRDRWHRFRNEARGWVDRGYDRQW